MKTKNVLIYKQYKIYVMMRFKQLIEANLERLLLNYTTVSQNPYFVHMSNKRN